MQIPNKKLKNGFEMPVFGLGTWQMGGRFEHNLSNDDDKDVADIQNAIESGITHIDTAESYADGHTETLVNGGIKGFDRSKLFLVSKVRSRNLGYGDIIKSCKASMERLGTNYLDLYLVHMYSPNTPLEESMRALDYLKEQGFIKNIGVCNFTLEHLAEAQSYTKNKIVCNQVHYNLIFREPERKGLLEYCQQNDVFLIAWRPVQKGELSENILPIMAEMCEKYQKTSAQIAITWLISQPNVITISKMSDVHLEENLGAIGWEMESVDIERLRKEYPHQKDVSDAVPLG